MTDRSEAADVDWRVRFTVETVVAAPDRQAAVSRAATDLGINLARADAIVDTYAGRVTDGSPTPAADALQQALEALYKDADEPNLRLIGQRMNRSHSTLWKAIQGHTIPQWGILQDLVIEMGGDKPGWIEKWRALHAAAVEERKSVKGK